MYGLPNWVYDIHQIQATMVDGLLTIRIPLKAIEKNASIKIEAKIQ